MVPIFDQSELSLSQDPWRIYSEGLGFAGTGLLAGLGFAGTGLLTPVELALPVGGVKLCERSLALQELVLLVAGLLCAR